MIVVTYTRTPYDSEGGPVPPIAPDGTSMKRAENLYEAWEWVGGSLAMIPELVKANGDVPTGVAEVVVTVRSHDIEIELYNDYRE